MISCSDQKTAASLQSASKGKALLLCGKSGIWSPKKAQPTTLPCCTASIVLPSLQAHQGSPRTSLSHKSPQDTCSGPRALHQLCWNPSQTPCPRHSSQVEALRHLQSRRWKQQSPLTPASSQLFGTALCSPVKALVHHHGTAELSFAYAARNPDKSCIRTLATSGNLRC